MNAKTALFLCAVLLGTVSPVPAPAQNAERDYLDMGTFGMSVESVTRIDRIETNDGKVRAENRDNCLVEVKLSGNAPGGGICIYNTASFAAVFKYRGYYRTNTSRAVGFRPEVAPGKIIDVFVSSPDANLDSSSDEAGTVEIYAIFEIPKEVDSFRIQIPTLVDREARIRD